MPSLTSLTWMFSLFIDDPIISLHIFLVISTAVWPRLQKLCEALDAGPVLDLKASKLVACVEGVNARCQVGKVSSQLIRPR